MDGRTTAGLNVGVASEWLFCAPWERDARALRCDAMAVRISCTCGTYWRTSESACISIKPALRAGDRRLGKPPKGGDRAPACSPPGLWRCSPRACCFGLVGGERPLGAVPVPAGQLGRGGWLYAAGPAMR